MGAVVTVAVPESAYAPPPDKADDAAGRLVAVVGACQGCGACLLTCPEHAIRPRGGALLVSEGRCSGCGECVEVCPVDAIELVVVCGASGGAL